MVTKLRRKFNVRENSGSAKAETVAGEDGKWLVKLDLSKDDGKGKDLIITGKNKIVAKDVITGEVWFCKTIEIKKNDIAGKKVFFEFGITPQEYRRQHLRKEV